MYVTGRVAACYRSNGCGNGNWHFPKDDPLFWGDSFDWIKGISGENIKLEIHRLWQPRIPAVGGILKDVSIAKYDILLEEDK